VIDHLPIGGWATFAHGRHRAPEWRGEPAHGHQGHRAGALDPVGWVQQVLVNQRSGFVVDGHARVALALRRGEPAVPGGLTRSAGRSSRGTPPR
jgi:hypothetical protein